jgi:hypothetical protein
MSIAVEACAADVPDNRPLPTAQPVGQWLMGIGHYMLWGMFQPSGIPGMN